MAINVTGDDARGGIQLDSSNTTVRQSSRSDFGAQLRNGIAASAGTVSTAVGVAAPFVPGGAVVAAAVSGVAGSVSGGSQMSGSGAGGVAESLPGAGPGLGTAAGGDAAGTGNAGIDKNIQATKDMQEMMASFNLQYLQLQEKMQAENRSFTTVSNVMKTKHDTAKSSISNVR